jgi:hypothetical protein
VKNGLNILVLTLMICLLTNGCSENANYLPNRESAEEPVLTVGQIKEFMKSNVSGQIGRTYASKWFDFTIISIEHVDYYAGVYQSESKAMLDILVEETNTSNKPIGMGTFDFYIAIDFFPDIDNDPYKLYPYDPFDDETTMMPTEFELAPGETVSYHMIFEYPDEVIEAQLIYTEVDEYDNEGATVSIPIPEMKQ